MRYTTIFALLSLYVSMAYGTTPSLEELSLEEKVGELLLVHFYGTSFNDAAKQFIEKAHVGGFIYYTWANPFDSPQEVQSLNDQLQFYAKQYKHNIPLFIAVDQEGGSVIRLKKGFSHFPSQKAIADTQNPSYAKACAYTTGKELRAVGVNVNFAPVVDVNCNPLNPIIGPRAFSDDPHIVTAFAKQALEGSKEAGILATLKHFPGHGDVTIDSHLALPVVNKSKEELLATELYPYIHLLPQADAIMTAHILFPFFDPIYCATLSKIILQDLLRNTLHFSGLVFCDSLVMNAITSSTTSIEEACVLAINAGCNVLVLGGRQLNDSYHNELSLGKIIRIHAHLVNAVQSGIIQESTLNACVEKIMAIKFKYESNQNNDSP